MIVLAAAFSATVLVFGGWILPTTYLYWQWFHYTRQSYGIERVYRAKAVRCGAWDERMSPRRHTLPAAAMGHLVYRSYQSPDEIPWRAG